MNDDNKKNEEANKKNEEAQKELTMKNLNSYFSYDRTFIKYFTNDDYRSTIVDVVLSGMVQIDLHLRNKFYKKLFSANHELVINNFPKRDEIIFYGENGEIIAKSEYQILGTFNNKEKFWQWAWSLPTLKENDKKHFHFARRILDSASNYLIPYIRFFFLSSLFYCKEQIQFDVFISLCRGFCHNPYVIMYSPYKMNKNMTEFEDVCIVLTDVENMNSYWQKFIDQYMEKHKYEFMNVSPVKVS